MLCTTVRIRVHANCWNLGAIPNGRAEAGRTDVQRRSIRIHRSPFAKMFNPHTTKNPARKHKQHALQPHRNARYGSSLLVRSDHNRRRTTPRSCKPLPCQSEEDWVLRRRSCLWRHNHRTKKCFDRRSLCGRLLGSHAESQIWRTNRENLTHTIEVDTINMHPSGNPSTKDHDFAVLHLEQP